jgi:hypothetical protein
MKSPGGAIPPGGGTPPSEAYQPALHELARILARQLAREHDAREQETEAEVEQ